MKDVPLKEGGEGINKYSPLGNITTGSEVSKL